MFVPNFKISSWGIFDEKFHIHYNGVRESKKEKKKKKAKINLSTLALFTVIDIVVLIVYTKFEYCSTHRCWAVKMEKLLERKKNGQIMRLISHMWLIL